MPRFQTHHLSKVLACAAGEESMQIKLRFTHPPPPQVSGMDFKQIQTLTLHSCYLILLLWDNDSGPVCDYKKCFVVANLCAVLVFFQVIGVVKSRPPVGPSSRAGLLVNSLRTVTQLYGLAQVVHHDQLTWQLVLCMHF